MNKVKQFVKAHKHYFLVMAALLAMAGVSGYIAFGYRGGLQTIGQRVSNSNAASSGHLDAALVAENSVFSDITDEKTGGPPKAAASEVDEDKESGVYFKSGGDSIAPEVSADLQAANGGGREETLAQKPESSDISATLAVGGDSYNARVVENSSVYDLMKQLSDASNFSFSGREYSGMGFFVEEINGVENDNRAGRYWIYYINGESAKLGVSNYIIQDNDLIEWKYETTNF